jgi:hypothetical protein
MIPNHDIVLGFDAMNDGATVSATETYDAATVSASATETYDAVIGGIDSLDCGIDGVATGASSSTLNVMNTHGDDVAGREWLFANNSSGAAGDRTVAEAEAEAEAQAEADAVYDVTVCTRAKRTLSFLCTSPRLPGCLTPQFGGHHRMNTNPSSSSRTAAKRSSKKKKKPSTDVARTRTSTRTSKERCGPSPPPPHTDAPLTVLMRCMSDPEIACSSQQWADAIHMFGVCVDGMMADIDDVHVPEVMATLMATLVMLVRHGPDVQGDNIGRVLRAFGVTDLEVFDAVRAKVHAFLARRADATYARLTTQAGGPASPPNETLRALADDIRNLPAALLDPTRHGTLMHWCMQVLACVAEAPPSRNLVKTTLLYCWDRMQHDMRVAEGSSASACLPSQDRVDALRHTFMRAVDIDVSCAKAHLPTIQEGMDAMGL